MQVKEGELTVQQGQTLKPDVVFHTDMRSWMGLFSGQVDPGEAISKGLIRIEDERLEDELGALRRFLKISGVAGLPSSVS